MKCILDVGCGNGSYSNIIYEKNQIRVCGIDPSSEMIKYAKKTYPIIDFKIGKAEHIPYPKNHFDLILLIHVIHHIDDLNKSFNEIRRVLNDNGWIAIVTYSHVQIRRRILNYYWPSTTNIDLNRYPKIDDIIKIMMQNKINPNCIEEISQIPIEIDLIRFKHRLISSLNFVSDSEFKNGLKKIEKDIEKKKIAGFKVKTIIWGNCNFG